MSVVGRAIPNRAPEVVESDDPWGEPLEARGRVAAKHGLAEMDSAAAGIEASDRKFEIRSAVWRVPARNVAIVMIDRRMDRRNNGTLGRWIGFAARRSEWIRGWGDVDRRRILHLPLLVPSFVDGAAFRRINRPVMGEELFNAEIIIPNHPAHHGSGVSQ